MAAPALPDTSSVFERRFSSMIETWLGQQAGVDNVGQGGADGGGQVRTDEAGQVCADEAGRLPVDEAGRLPVDEAGGCSADDRGPVNTDRPGVWAAEVPRTEVTARLTDATGSGVRSPAVAVPTDGEGNPGNQFGGLTEILQTLTTMPDVDWHEVSGQGVHDALDLLEQIDRRLTGIRAQVLATAETNGLWALKGARTFQSWWRERSDTTAGSASRQVRHARALRDHFPLARAALERGEIGHEHVGVLVREALLTERLRTQLSDPDLGEAFLVGQAQAMDAGTFTKLVKAWAIAADPEGADRAWREADAKEELTVASTLGGYHVSGWLDDVSGRLVREALNAHMGRKSEGDNRTPAQRRAAALVMLAHQSLDAGLQGSHARVRPHLTVTTSWETFQALVAATGSVVPPSKCQEEPFRPGAAFGLTAEDTLTAPGGPRDPATPAQATLLDLTPEAREWLHAWSPGHVHVISAAIDSDAMVGVEPATLDDGTPIPPALLARLACDSGVSRVVFGPESAVLDVGREKRIFTAHQAKAIIARDRHCQYPRCDEPPGHGEIHHSLHWYKDHGPTDVDHGLYVCWHHHDWIHAHAITIVRANGSWHFYDRNGRLIT